MSIFNAVTHDFDDLVKSIVIQNQHEDDLKTKHIRTVRSQQYGHCYEITFGDNHQSSLHSVELVFDRSLRLFFDIPFHFHTNSRSSKIINTEVGKRMILPVTYEILRINHDTNCRQYSDSYTGSYDECKISSMEQMLQAEFNCTVPFLMKSGSLCVGKAAKDASHIYDKQIQLVTKQCPRSCHKIIPMFGLPRYYNTENPDEGKIKLYLHNMVKITEDYVSYDLLR